MWRGTASAFGPVMGRTTFTPRYTPSIASRFTPSRSTLLFHTSVSLSCNYSTTALKSGDPVKEKQSSPTSTHTESKSNGLTIHQDNTILMNLAFVNRVESTTTLASEMLKNARRAAGLARRQRIGDKYVFLFSGHLFGAGKTRLGEEVLVQAKRLYDDTPYLKQMWDNRYTKEELETFFNATRVEIDFKEWRRPSSKELSEALASFFYKVLAGSLQINAPRPPHVQTLRDVIEWVKEEAKLPGLFLHVDEIGDITSNRFNNFFDWLPIPITADTNALDESIIKANLSRYYNVWEELVVAVQAIPGVYLYVTGKQPYLSMIGKGLHATSSPSDSRPIPLECLTTKYIAETIEKTELDGKKLRNRLGLDQGKCMELSTVLFQETAGLPRLISKALHNLAENPEVLKGDMHNAVMLALCNVATPGPGDIKNPHLQHLYFFLYLASQLKWTFKSDVEAKLPGKPTPLTQVADLLNVYLESDGGNRNIIKPVIPRHYMRSFLAQNSTSPALSVLKAFDVPSLGGEKLELLLATLLFFRFDAPTHLNSLSNKWGDIFLPLANTSVSRLSVPAEPLTKMELRKEDITTSRTTDLANLPNGFYMGIPPPKSPCADIIINSPDVLVLLQTKHYVKARSTWTDIAGEVKKNTKFIKKGRKTILVFMSLSLKEDVQQDIVSAGEKNLTLPTGKYTMGTATPIEIPEGMELVIVSEDGFKEVVSADVFKDLLQPHDLVAPLAQFARGEQPRSSLVADK